MRKDMYQIQGWSFIGAWLGASLLVWPLSVLAIAIILAPFAILTSQVVMTSAGDMFAFLAIIFIIPIIGATISFVLASLQRRLMRNRLFWAADHWRRWSMAGGALGAYAVVAEIWLVEWLIDGYWLSDQVSFFLAMPIFMVFVSAAQWIVLRHAVRDGWLWILGNFIAGIVFSGILVRNHPDPYSYNETTIQLLLALFAALAQGAITGYVILFLFEKKLLPMEPAHATVPIRTEERSKSVWDEAV